MRFLGQKKVRVLSLITIIGIYMLSYTLIKSGNDSSYEIVSKAQAQFGGFPSRSTTITTTPLPGKTNTFPARTTTITRPPDTNLCNEEEGEECPTSQFRRVLTYEVEGYGTLTLGQAAGLENTFFFIDSTGTNETSSVMVALAAALCPDSGTYEQLKANPSYLSICKNRYPKIFSMTSSQFALGECDRITGTSPALFFYPEEKTHLSVSTGKTITYSDPPVSGNTISFTANPDGQIASNGVTRDYFYYEYDPRNVVFKSPNTGFVVSIDNVQPTVEEIATRLNLTAKETKRLSQDVKNALPANSKHILLSVASEDEVNRNVPLTFSTSPDTIHRIHILVKKVDALYSLEEPELLPLERDGFTVIELGAYTL